MSKDAVTVFFDKAFGAFESAVANSQLIVRYYRIAEETVCLKFAGDALVSQITLAFEHLAITSVTDPKLTICIADSDTTRISLILPAWLQDDRLPRGEIRSLSDARHYTIYNHHTGAMNLIDIENNRALFWAQAVRYLPWWICGSPLQRILHCWMKHQGKQLTHAGAIGTSTGGVLLAGKSGSGKSTTALACLENGLQYVSEDYCLIATTPQPYCYSVYNSAKLEPNTLKMFSHLNAYCSNPQRKLQEKAFLFQQHIYPERIISGFPIRAVLILDVTSNPHTQIKPASIVQGLLALAPSTMFQLSNCDQQTLDIFTTLLQQVPCYKLALGRDLQQLTDVIKQLIQAEVVI